MDHLTTSPLTDNMLSAYSPNPEIRLGVPGSLPYVNELNSFPSESSFLVDELLHRNNGKLNEADMATIMDLKSGVFKDYKNNLHLFNPWPSSLFVPQNDKKSYYPFFNEAPLSNQYARSWNIPGSGVTNASEATGNVYAFCSATPGDSFLNTEAGLGILYTPDSHNILSTVSFEPEIVTVSNNRWYVDFKSAEGNPAPDFTPHPLIIANTRCTGSIILAAWELNPVNGDVDLIPNTVKHQNLFDSSNSGLGFSAVQTKNQNFSGKSLSTRILVQQGHVYLFGVIARIAIHIQVSDAQGRPYPELQELQFKVWGDISCKVPEISVLTETVYQKERFTLEDFIHQTVRP